MNEVIKTHVITRAEDKQNVRMPLNELLTPTTHHQSHTPLLKKANTVVSVESVLNNAASPATSYSFLQTLTSMNNAMLKGMILITTIHQNC